MFGRRKIESGDDIVVALPTEGDEASRPSRMAGARSRPAAGREAEVVPLTPDGGGLAAAANIRSTPRGPKMVLDHDDTAESTGPSPRRSVSAGDDDKGGAFGRRRTDRIAAAAISTAAAKPDEPRVGAATTDRTASVDETARMTQVNRSSIRSAKERVQPLLMDVMDVASAAKLPRGELAQQITDIVTALLGQLKLQLNLFEQRDLVTLIINDMIGLGPLEPLLADDSISEVMVNGPQRIYIERNGKLALSEVTFQNEQHLMNVATRIVTGVGRRVDESSPICDARLKDGSRVNVIVPPLAIDGTVITIRKFAKNKLDIDDLIALDTLSPAGAQLLKVIAASRCNVLISGGTGSGKTTLLNCLTQFIHPGERIITCEDAAELQLQQPHVVRLETRPANLEGAGEITMRDLVRNCLRMRPERIIVGEVRGSEAFDLLQAMNTGHDGSMGTVHANNPREAISRLENMIAMGGFNMPAKSVREQIASALSVIIQTQRLRDGTRKVTHVTEVIGMEGEAVTLQDLFVYDFEGEHKDGRVRGEHRVTGLRPSFWERAKYFGHELELAEALHDVTPKEVKF